MSPTKYLEDGDEIDFNAVVPQKWDDPELTITVQSGFSFNGGKFLQARITQATTTASGRKGKPKHLITITVDKDEGMVGLLNSLEHCFELGTVEIGARYTARPKPTRPRPNPAKKGGE